MSISEQSTSIEDLFMSYVHKHAYAYICRSCTVDHGLAGIPAQVMHCRCALSIPTLWARAQVTCMLIHVSACCTELLSVLLTGFLMLRPWEPSLLVPAGALYCLARSRHSKWLLLVTHKCLQHPFRMLLGAEHMPPCQEWHVCVQLCSFHWTFAKSAHVCDESLEWQVCEWLHHRWHQVQHWCKWLFNEHP